MMHTVISAVSAPLPAVARATVLALLAIATIGTIELWHQGTAAEPATTALDAAQPLAPAPMSVDMWRF